MKNKLKMSKQSQRFFLKWHHPFRTVFLLEDHVDTKDRRNFFPATKADNRREKDDHTASTKI
jgi:hypothetical protein